MESDSYDPGERPWDPGDTLELELTGLNVGGEASGLGNQVYGDATCGHRKP